MTSLVARILLSIMLLPLAAAIYLVVFLAISHGPSQAEFAFACATLVTVCFVAAYWLWLWRHSVLWTKQRIWRTIISGVACIATGVLAGVALSRAAGSIDASLGFFVAGLLCVVCWLPTTVILWRETPRERVERLRQTASGTVFCPRCGYNMTGLAEARCPECGAKFTLDVLYSAQMELRH
jgi:hypothetical protein